MTLLCLPPCVPEASRVTLLPSPASALSYRDPAGGAPLSGLRALPPTSREHQEGSGSQGGHSIPSPASTADAAPGWPRPPTPQHVPGQSPPKPVSETPSQAVESATRNASKYFQPPCAALAHFPAVDASSQMLSIPSLKQDSDGSLLGGPCQHSTDDHMLLKGTFFLQSSSNESPPLFLPSRTALASQTCEVGHIYYFKFSSSHIKKTN